MIVRRSKTKMQQVTFPGWLVFLEEKLHQAHKRAGMKSGCGASHAACNEPPGAHQADAVEAAETIPVLKDLRQCHAGGRDEGGRGAGSDAEQGHGGNESGAGIPGGGRDPFGMP